LLLVIISTIYNTLSYLTSNQSSSPSPSITSSIPQNTEQQRGWWQWQHAVLLATAETVRFDNNDGVCIGTNTVGSNTNSVYMNHIGINSDPL
jgi:hypothetical protein